MQNYYSDRLGQFDLPVSRVRSDSSVKSALAKKLDEFENLELAPQDEGFLRLAKMILEPADDATSRPGAGWDGNGLIS